MLCNAALCSDVLCCAGLCLYRLVCAGQVPSPPGAVFKSLPPRQTLTLNFDAPEMWLVEPTVAQHDLDNLRLEQLDASMLHAEFELEALMLTGRCIDMHSKRRDLVG